VSSDQQGSLSLFYVLIFITVLGNEFKGQEQVLMPQQPVSSKEVSGVLLQARVTWANGPDKSIRENK
jgi:hypothetical protein